MINKYLTLKSTISFVTVFTQNQLFSNTHHKNFHNFIFIELIKFFISLSMNYSRCKFFTPIKLMQIYIYIYIYTQNLFVWPPFFSAPRHDTNSRPVSLDPVWPEKCLAKNNFVKKMISGGITDKKLRNRCLFYEKILVLLLFV